MGYAAALAWYELSLFSECPPSNDSIGFPETIDKLDPEIGQVGGPQPIIFGMPGHCIKVFLLTLIQLGLTPLSCLPR